MLACCEIRSKSENGGAAIRMQQKNLHRIAEIEVEDLVGGEDVHLGEGALFEQVINRCAHGPHAALEFHIEFRRISAAIPAALDRMRLELEQRLNFFCSHCRPHILEWSSSQS